MIIKYTLYFYGFGYISNVLEPGQSLTFRIRIGLPTLSGYLERILSIYSCEIQRYTDTDVSFFLKIFLLIYFCAFTLAKTFLRCYYTYELIISFQNKYSAQLLTFVLFFIPFDRWVHAILLKK